MSLIEEALRRVQDPHLPKDPAATTLPPPPKPETRREEPPQAHSWPAAPEAPRAPAPRSSAPRSWTPLFIGLAASAIMLWLVGAAWLLRDTRTASPRRSAAPAAAPVSENPAGPSGSIRSLVLSGVVVGAGEPYAVIDGRIVSRGEEVNGAVVQAITPREVRVRRADGSELVLSVPR